MPRHTHVPGTRLRSQELKMLRQRHQTAQQLQRPGFLALPREFSFRRSACNEKSNLRKGSGQKQVQKLTMTLRIEAQRRATEELTAVS